MNDVVIVKDNVFFCVQMEVYDVFFFVYYLFELVEGWVIVIELCLWQVKNIFVMLVDCYVGDVVIFVQFDDMLVCVYVEGFVFVVIGNVYFYQQFEVFWIGFLEIFGDGQFVDKNVVVVVDGICLVVQILNVGCEIF